MGFRAKICTSNMKLGIKERPFIFWSETINIVVNNNFSGSVFPIRFSLDEYFFYIKYTIVSLYFCTTPDSFRHRTLLVFIGIGAWINLYNNYKCKFHHCLVCFIQRRVRSLRHDGFCIEQQFRYIYSPFGSPFVTLDESLAIAAWLTYVPVRWYNVHTLILIKFMIYSGKVLIEFTLTCIFGGIK